MPRPALRSPSAVNPRSLRFAVKYKLVGGGTAMLPPKSPRAVEPVGLVYVVCPPTNMTPKEVCITSQLGQPGRIEIDGGGIVRLCCKGAALSRRRGALIEDPDGPRRSNRRRQTSEGETCLKR